MPKYKVFVDDNFHYMDESERYAAGEFDAADQAIAKCKEIVDSCFKEIEPHKQSLEELVRNYTFFGEDPYIVSDDKSCKFSARDYARQRANELAKKDRSTGGRK